MKKTKQFMKRMLAFALILVVEFGSIPFSTAGLPTRAAELKELAAKTREVDVEGTVLLKNDNQVLPLEGKKVSIFGRAQINTFWTGYGSGGYVQSSYKTNVLDEMKKKKNITVNEDLAKIYTDWVKKNPGYEGNVWRTAPHSNPEMEITDAQVSDAKKKSDVAVVVIGRRWGEGVDLKMGQEDGSYFLTTKEKNMLKKVNSQFDDIVLVLNTASVMDMEWIAKNTYNNIDAIVLSWLGGMEAGSSIADVLVGEGIPSGKLPVTIMDSLDNEPTNNNYGGGPKDSNYKNKYNTYEEDIYLGYRYTETFGDEHVLYPFGYGLGYTSFETKVNSVTVQKGKSVKEDKIEVNVTVTNTGKKYAGKEVVQVYYEAPQGKLGKPSRALAAYAKTENLQPGASQSISLTFPVSTMASYDDAGKTKYKSAYILEEGTYNIYVGNSVKAEKAPNYDGYVVDSLTLVEQLEEALAPTVQFDRVVPKKSGNKLVVSKEKVPKATRNYDNRITKHVNSLKEYKKTSGKKQLIDVYKGNISLEDFVAQLSNDDLARLCRGDKNMNSGKGLSGNAGVFGGSNDSLEKTYGVPPVSACDGPSGIRWSGKASVIPSAIILGSTWNDQLVEDICELLGKECIATTGNNNKSVDVLLAPGMNVIRNPRCGRDYEYFSEDPLLTGRLASAYVSGLQKTGTPADVKHFAAYQQGMVGSGVTAVDSRASERALREIYLKAFEIAIKESNPYTVMDSNGKINGEQAHHSFDLNTHILRDEWGWEGMVMTDWGPPSASYNGNRGTLKNNAYRVQAGSDVNMPGNKDEGTLEDSLKASNGITRKEVQRSAMDVLKVIMKTPKFRRDNKLEFDKYVEPEYEAFTVETKKLGDPRLESISIDGEALYGFNPSALNYTIFHQDMNNIPEVTCKPQEGVEYEIKTVENEVTITTTLEGGKNVYKIIFTNEAGLEPTVEDPQYAYINKLLINGVEIPGFYPTDYLYNFEVADPKNAKIEYEAKEDVTITQKYDESNNMLIIRSETIHQALEYNINCGGGLKGDEFEGNALNSCWKVQNKNDNLSVKDGALQIKTEKGSWYNKEEDDDTIGGIKNLVSQEASGDWESVTEIEYTQLTEAYQALGVMVTDDNSSGDYLWFRLECTGTSSDIRIQVNKEIDNSNKEVAKNVDYAVDNNVNSSGNRKLYFKVAKSGNAYTFEISTDGKNYTKIGETTADFTTPTFGLAAFNSNSEEEVTVKFNSVQFGTSGSVGGSTTEMPDPFVIKSEKASTLYVAEEAYYMNKLGVEDASGKETGHKNLCDVSTDSFALYSINVEKKGYYEVTAQFASEVSSEAFDQFDFGFEVDGVPAVKWTTLGGTDGAQNWKTMEKSEVYLGSGQQKLKVYFITTNMNLAWIKFEPKLVGVDEPKVQEAKAELDKTIANAKSTYETAGNDKVYTVETWTTFKLAYEKATNLPDNIGATRVARYDKELAAAWKALEKRQEPPVDEELEAAKDALTAAIEDAKKLNKKDYTSASWKKLQDAIKAAEVIVVNETASIEQVEQCSEDLANAVAELEISGAVNAKTELSLLCTKARLLRSSEYTSDSWNVLKAAKENAEKILADGNATEDELKAANAALQNAMDNLVTKEYAEAQAELADVIRDAEMKKQTDYTAQSWAVLQNALQNAKAVNGSETQEQLKSLINALDAAIKGLQKAEAPALPNETPILTDIETKIAAAYGVTPQAAQAIGAVAAQYGVSADTIQITDTKIKGLKSDKDIAGSSFADIKAKASKQTKSSIKISWNKVSGADGYLVYGNTCGKKNSYKLLKDTKSTSLTHKKLKKATSYKYLVVAYKNVSGVKATLAASKVIHTITKGGKTGVAKSVKVTSGTKVSLKVGKTKKIKAREVKSDKKIDSHRKLSYESDNSKIATVNASGKITAKKKGKCNIYVYAQNGVYAKIRVTVK